MSCIAQQASPSHRLTLLLRVSACLALLCVVAACGSHPGHRTSAHYAPSRYYPPPGPPSDPWGPYVREASGRFGVPETWIRRVMRQESGGQEDVVSWAGAMGLMQVMPDTYTGLRARYQLGSDPFDPRNNILAGTAYLREMYDRFGAPGFLAAYNAGPNRLDAYLTDGTPLPDETVNYVAAIAPRLGPGTPLSGPLAVYGSPGGSLTRFASLRSFGGCDPDAAYNPDGPCAPRRPAAAPIVTASASPSQSYASAGCDPDAAYNPNRPCTPLRQAAFQPVTTEAATPAASYASAGCDPDAAYNPNRPCAPLRQAAFQPVITEAASTAATYGSAGCDPDAAYNPNGPCTPPRQAAFQPVATEAVTPAASYASAGCDPDAAYNPNGPCRPAPISTAVIAEPLPRPARPPGITFAQNVRSVAMPAARPVSFETGRWAIQVGAFANLSTALAAAELARMAAPDLLRTARTELPPTSPFGGKVAYRARLAGLSPSSAATACARLSGRGLACMTVPPTSSSF